MNLSQAVTAAKQIKRKLLNLNVILVWEGLDLFLPPVLYNWNETFVCESWKYSIPYVYACNLDKGHLTDVVYINSESHVYVNSGRVPYMCIINTLRDILKVLDMIR